MTAIGTFQSCTDSFPFKSPCEVCYVLSFEATETDPFPASASEVTLHFGDQWALAKLTTTGGKRLIVSCHGPRVSGMQQLGVVLGLRNGDHVMLRRETAENTYSIHRV